MTAPRVFIVVLVMLVVLVVTPAANARAVRVMPGVTYERILSWTAAGPRATYVVRGPKPEGLYRLTPLLSNGTITGRETVSSMQRTASGQMTSIGVNGDYFDWAGGWPSGLLIRSGVIEHQPVPGRASLGIDASGVLHVERVPWFARWRGADASYRLAALNGRVRANTATLFTPVWGAKTPTVRGVAVVLDPFPPTVARRDLTGTVTAIINNSSVAIPPQGAVLVARGTAADEVLAQAVVGSPLTLHIPLVAGWEAMTDAVSAGPTLIKDGRPIYNSGEALTRSQQWGRHPRTAVGQRADGGIVMVAVDGRQPGWSVGITNWEMALLLLRYGCVTAFGLDSGGSTTLAFDGRVLNRPSDRTGERPVAEALVLAYTGIYVPPPAPTLSPNGDGVAERQTLAYKLVRPSLVSAKVVGPTGATIELDSGQRAAGRYAFAWPGTDAPEGRYRWSVTATDDLGRASTDERAFTLDRTLGFVRVSPGARRIEFVLARDATIRVAIETTGGNILRTIATGQRAAGPVVVSWNGRDGRGKRVRRGSYAVRVAASSPIGLSELRIPVRITR